MSTALTQNFSDLAERTMLAVTQTSITSSATQTTTDTIYSTTDYDRFTLLPGNRAVDPKHVRKLVTLINTENLLHATPILVTVELAVLDGQHRLAAARELSTPIFYRVASTLDEQHITTLNTAQKSWQGADYLHRWTVLGKPDYQALSNFMERHPTLSFSNARMMVSGSSNNRADEFRIGLFKAANMQKAEDVAIIIERIQQEAGFKNAFDTRFVAAVYHCFENVIGFEPAVFMRKIMHNPRALRPCATHKQYLEMFSEIYNYKTAEANKVRFY